MSFMGTVPTVLDGQGTRSSLHEGDYGVTPRLPAVAVSVHTGHMWISIL